MVITGFGAPILRGVEHMFDQPLRYSGSNELRVAGTNHCDALGETGQHCASLCGDATPDGLASFARVLGKDLGGDVDYKPMEGARAVGHPRRYRSWTTQSNVSTLVGGGYSSSRDYSGGAAVTWALRPELLFRKYSAAVGGGFYAELAGGRGRTSVGGGVMGVVPIVAGEHATFALAPSFGADVNAERDFHPAAVFGAFLGLRHFHHGSFFEVPVGARFDYRHGLDAARERAWAVSLQVDLWLLPALLVGAAMPP